MRVRNILCLCLLALCAACGCISWGFQGFNRDELNIYDEMLGDLVKPFTEDTWFWVRGKATGDLDGDEKDEEAVLVTFHKGPKEDGTPFYQAVLLFCHRDPDNNRPVLLRRLPIFLEGKTLSATALPEGIHLDRSDAPMLNASAKIVDVEGNGNGLVFVTLSSKPEGGRALCWHAGFAFQEKGPPTQVFGAVALQREADVILMDLDKDGKDEVLLRQAVLTSTQAPQTEEMDAPTWLSVFARQADGQFIQKDASYPNAYDMLLLPWYQNYVRAEHEGAGDSALAPFEYYLGRCHLMQGETSSARRFLKRAATHGEGRLRILAREAMDQESVKK